MSDKKHKSDIRSFFTNKTKLDDGVSSSSHLNISTPDEPKLNSPKNNTLEKHLESDSNENITGMCTPSCSYDTHPVAVEEPSNSNSPKSSFSSLDIGLYLTFQ